MTLADILAYPLLVACWCCRWLVWAIGVDDG